MTPQVLQTATQLVQVDSLIQVTQIEYYAVSLSDCLAASCGALSSLHWHKGVSLLYTTESFRHFLKTPMKNPGSD